MKKSKIEISDFLDIQEKEQTLRIIPIKPMILSLGGNFDLAIDKMKFRKESKIIILDFNSLNEYDTYLVLFINKFKSIAETNNLKIDIQGLSQEQDDFYRVFDNSGKVIKPVHTPFFRKFFSNVGTDAITLFNDLRLIIEFYGELTINIVGLFIRPNSIRWKDFPFHFSRAGINAVFICLLILTLLGLITGYQGAVQLHQFGADIFIADLVGISIVRELSPLMIAILVAGRSGSAFAAEIGTMKVSEEIDALKSMGFDPIKFLVMPRVLSVAFAMPFLTLLGDIAGVGGGLIASLTTLDISLTGFINELQKSVSIGDLMSGLGKSIIFGVLIASVGCFRGLQVRGGAESVGKYTTSSVVTGILMIIFADAIFTFLFQLLGI